MTYFIAFKLEERLERAYSFIYENDTVILYKYLGKRNYSPYGDVYVAFTTLSQVIYCNSPKIQFSNDVYIDGFKATFYAFKLLHKNESWWGLKPETIFEVIVQLYFKNTSDKPKYYIIFDDKPKYKHIYIIEPITKSDFLNIIKEYEASALWSMI
jgi:hypothetical protein